MLARTAMVARKRYGEIDGAPWGSLAFGGQAAKWGIPWSVDKISSYHSVRRIPSRESGHLIGARGHPPARGVETIRYTNLCLACT